MRVCLRLRPGDDIYIGRSETVMWMRITRLGLHAYLNLESSRPGPHARPVSMAWPLVLADAHVGGSFSDLWALVVYYFAAVHPMDN